MNRTPTLPTLARKPYNVLLPLYPRVIFVDWYGVLSNDVFWSSILNNKKHPYHQPLKDAYEDLFTQDQALKSWMKGELTSKDIVQTLKVRLGRKYKADFLLRTLEADCRRMTINKRLFYALQAVRADSFVVIATDNMDCFYSQVDCHSDLRDGFDSVLCSSMLRVLKSESATRFFGPWLLQHRLSFSQALLLDDSEVNCRNFEGAGGRSVLVTSIDQAIQEIKSWDNNKRNTYPHIARSKGYASIGQRSAVR
jgi:FMN phosphatase YigB (HAD superfamily)